MQRKCTRIWTFLIAAGALIWSAGPLAHAQLSTTLTYQGVLAEDGEPVTTDRAAFAFALWDAPEGGRQVGDTYRIPDPIAITDGLFTVPIETRAFGVAAFNGYDRWLEISVDLGGGWEVMRPRQPITPAAYALYAYDAPDTGGDCLWTESGGNVYRSSGNVGVGTTSPGYKLHVIDSIGGTAITGENLGEGTEGSLGHEYAGVYGLGPDGVMGETTSPTGAAVYGTAGPSASANYAIRGHTTNDDGYAAYFTGGKNYFEGPVGIGVDPSTTVQLRVWTDTFWGVLGRTSHTSGQGVRGYASAGSGPAVGVYGFSASPEGAGIYGETTNVAPAVKGFSNYGTGEAGWFESTYGDGIFAQASATGKAALRADCTNGASGVVIEQDVTSFQDIPAFKIDSTGSSGEPLAMDVIVDADFGKLARFDLNGSAGYIGTAFSVTAETSGTVAEFIGEYSWSDGDTLYAQCAGTGSAVYAVNTLATTDAPAVYGKADAGDASGIGVKGQGGYKGVEGRVYPSGSDYYYGVYGYASGGSGWNRAIYGYATGGSTNYAGYFSGDVQVTGSLSKGSGTFKIDHPLDPENKYLYHSFVESPDMMNIYNGNAVLDEDGTAVVTMPEWFEALNREFRYQLTCIGGFAQVYIAEEISGNQFKIAGGKPGMKVSWQVTGVRQDAYAQAHRVQVEVDKPENERGTYLHPEEWGMPIELQVDHAQNADKVAPAGAVAKD